MKQTPGHSPGRAVRRPRRTERTLDNLTHALVGAAISKAGAERATPLATATLVIAANAPDIDVFSYVRGEYFALAFRRGITHGLPALVILPFVVAGAMLGWDRWIRRRRHPSAEPARGGAVLLLAFAGVITHPTLDWMNSYGMRWGLPFDGSWSYGDALFIVDPWIWLALGGSVFLASAPGRRGLAGWGVLTALTSAVVLLGVGGPVALPWLLGLAAIITVRVAGRGGGMNRRRLVAGAGIAVLVYVGAMVVAVDLARAEVLPLALALSTPAEDVMVAPVRGNPFFSVIEIQTSESYVPGTHDWLGSPRVRLDLERAVPLFATSGGVPEDLGRRIAGVARTRTSVRNYLTWSRYPYVRVTPDSDGWAVRFSDARYDDEAGAGGLAGVTVHVSTADIQ